MSSDEHQATEQQARDIEALLARARLADRPPMTAADKLRAQTLAAIAQFERETRAAAVETGRDPFEQVRHIADGYADAKDDAEQLADYLDHLGNELTLADVRALRLATQAGADVTPHLICQAIDQGRKAADVARELGVSEGYVYRILRERPTGAQ
jgi:hypothetical protein